MTVATWVCCSMISESQIAYGSRVPCHGRSCRPCFFCQVVSFAAMPDAMNVPPRRQSRQEIQLTIDRSKSVAQLEDGFGDNSAFVYYLFDFINVLMFSRRPGNGLYPS